MTFFYIVFLLVVAQRLVELQIAKRNARKIISLGGYEVGQDHYHLFILLHSGFFTALWLEAILNRFELPSWWAVPFAIFVVAQALRVWCIRSLGSFWNTRIFVIPGMELVRKGPYRWLRHPNYVVVCLEIVMLPLLFGCYRTAFVFTCLNLLLLRKRIQVEEQSLSEAVSK